MLNFIIALAQAQHFMQILEPQALKDKFPDGIYIILGNFGNPQYNTKQIGKLVFPDNEIACTELDPLPNSDDIKPIFVLRRGDCSFVEKIKNAELGGAHGTLIINNEPSNYRIQMIKPLNMPDSGINYFGASLKLEEGNLIYDYKEQNITIEIDFTIPQIQRTELVLAHIFDRQISKDYFDKLFNELRYGSVSEIIIKETWQLYLTSECLLYGICNVQRDCLEHSQFCYISKHGLTGRQILEQILYSLCALDITVQEDTYYERFIEFWLFLNDQCTTNYQKSCIESALTQSGYTLSRIQSCANSDTKRRMLLDGDQLLAQSIDLYSDLLTIPGIVYNGIYIRGDTPEDTFHSVFCSGINSTYLCGAQDPTPDDQVPQDPAPQDPVPQDPAPQDPTPQDPQDQTPQQPQDCSIGCTSQLLHNNACDAACNNDACYFDNGLCKKCNDSCQISQIRNDVCDEECNTESCFYDNYKCCTCNESLLKNQFCDRSCNIPECNYDNGMCEQCSPGCYPSDIGNDICNDNCNNSKCQFDRGDCNCDCPQFKLGDGICDQECNNKLCDYDLEDCKIVEIVENEEETETEATSEKGGGEDEGLSWINIGIIVGCSIFAVIAQFVIRIALTVMVVRKARRQRSNEPGRDISEIHNPFLLIPIQPYTKVLQEFGDSCCSICLVEQILISFSEGVRVRKTLCYHIFHYQCLDEWLESRRDRPTCPNCNRNPLEPKIAML